MPFKALCDGEPVISLDFAAPAWREEKARQRAGGVAYACPACGEPMALATSQRGRPFFKHYPDSDCPNSAPKSAEHERLQVAVYQRCRELGWATDIEARGPGGRWTADVLAARGAASYAFEVQLAPISGEDLEARSAKYRASGIVPVWLLRKCPARCPVPVPSRTFATAWTRKADAWYPDRRHPAAAPDDRIEEDFLNAETVHWSLDETLVCWRELGAVLAEFDADDPDRERMILRGRPTTLVEVVSRALGGELLAEFAASIQSAYDHYYECAAREERARVDRDRLLGEVRRVLREHERERLRSADLKDLMS
jgi:predicted RNA-binding Zn-ribbon protein involved in translation (DUF1610 family)